MCVCDSGSSLVHTIAFPGESKCIPSFGTSHQLMVVECLHGQLIITDDAATLFIIQPIGSKATLLYIVGGLGLNKYLSCKILHHAARISGYMGNHNNV